MKQVGIFSAIFLIMSNMLGSGVFMLPSILAKIGGISLFGWLFAMLGVIALALVFAKLSQLLPYGAGPYDYTKSAFGDYVGYQTNYVYSIASWVGNVSMITVIMGYLVNLYPVLSNPIYIFVIELSIIWLCTLLNIYGARIIGIIQGIALLFALLPILFLSIFGWYWFDLNLFKQSFNPNNLSIFESVNLSFNNIMWAFIGIESACVSARLIKNAKRNIPIATICGVLIATFLYISTCTVIMGIIPNQILVSSSAPFALVIQHIFGIKFVILISLCAIINCLGSLFGWTLVIGQTASKAANDGLFPQIFAKLNTSGVPVFGLIIIAIIMSIIVFITLSPQANLQFEKIITMSVILYLIPYIYSGLSIIVVAYKHLTKPNYIGYVVLGILSSLFCMWSILGSNKPITVWAFLVMMSCTFFYAFNRHKEIEKNHEKINS